MIGLGRHGHHGHHGGGWWGNYGPYGGYWPGYEVGPLYISSPVQACAWYEQAKSNADGSVSCQAPATWLVVAGLGAAALVLLARRK